MSAGDLTGYRLAPAARNDLEDIWLYSAQQCSVEQANRYADILEDTIDQLLFMPEMGRVRSEFDPPVRIHPSAEDLIVYRIENEHLSIVCILGAGQDWQAVLRTLDQ